MLGRLAGVLAAVTALAVPGAHAFFSVGTDPSSAAIAEARSLAQVVEVRATAALGTTVTWRAETASGIVTGYRVRRYAGASGGAAMEVCAAAQASKTASCTDPSALAACYTVTALYTPPGSLRRSGAV